MEHSRVHFSVYIVDAFASKTFTGNPAAVCVLEQGMELSDEMMQRIAAEVNQTTTAFVRRCDRSIATIKEDSFIAPNGNEFDLRWFTPTMENPFCGHATLATSAVIFDIYKNTFQEAKFKTKTGLHTARLKNGFIELDFPINLGYALGSVEQTQLQPLVDVCSAICGTDAIVAVRFSPGTRYMMVHLSDGVDLEKLIVDPSRFLAVQPQSIKLNGVILTVRGNLPEMATGSGYDFISRFFGPWLGIPEDHVCGSAHTVLAPYWTSVLGKDVKKARMVSTRGGDLLLDIRENGRIGIGGTCQIVLRGQFTL